MFFLFSHPGILLAQDSLRLLYHSGSPIKDLERNALERRYGDDWDGRCIVNGLYPHHIARRFRPDLHWRLYVLSDEKGKP